MSQTDKDALAQLQSDVAKVMDTPEGRRVLWWVADGVCGYSRATFAGEHPQLSSYNQGRREAAVELIARLQEWAPRGWARRVEEWSAEYVRKASEKRITGVSTGHDTFGFGREQ